MFLSISARNNKWESTRIILLQAYQWLVPMVEQWIKSIKHLPKDQEKQHRDWGLWDVFFFFESISKREIKAEKQLWKMSMLYKRHTYLLWSCNLLKIPPLPVLHPSQILSTGIGHYSWYLVGCADRSTAQVSGRSQTVHHEPQCCQIYIPKRTQWNNCPRSVDQCTVLGELENKLKSNKHKVSSHTVESIFSLILITTLAV